MKGMQKISRGKSFAGVVFYALRSASHHKTIPSVIGGNMVGSSAEDLIAEFNTTKTLRPDVAKPVWHNSLRLPKNEALTNSEWTNIADDYMKRMGFSETHLRCYVLHDDKAGQHIHIIASRIELSSGKLYLGKNENLISTRIIQQLELDYSLTRTKGLEFLASPSRASAYPKPKRKKSRNEAMMEKRTGELCPKTIIQNALEVFVANKPSTTEFVHQLVAQNIRAIPNIASTGRMNGFSFEYQGIVFKASQLGKRYSWAELQNKIDYQAERDSAFLLKQRASANESPNKAITPEITAENATATLLLEAGAKGSIAIGKLKESPKRSYTISTFRWLETIPYLQNIIAMLKDLQIPTLKRPKKHKTITGMRVVEITPIPQKNLIESAPQSKRTSLSM